MTESLELSVLQNDAVVTSRDVANRSCVIYVCSVEPPQCFKSLECARNVFACCPFVVFLHRHDDVTPSWFRALESYVLRVLAMMK